MNLECLLCLKTIDDDVVPIELNMGNFAHPLCWEIANREAPVQRLSEAITRDKRLFLAILIETLAPYQCSNLIADFNEARSHLLDGSRITNQPINQLRKDKSNVTSQ